MAKRISETELILPALFLMSLEKDGYIFTSDLKKKLFEILKPTGEDAQESPSRPGEPKFMQKVGNLKSHDTFERNSYAVYKRVEGNGGFQITNEGEKPLEIQYLIGQIEQHGIYR